MDDTISSLLAPGLSELILTDKEPAPHRVYYRDIDSVFTTGELPTGSGLGEMKLEFLAPKSYRLSTTRGKSR
jgi:hypothetical protein